MSQGRCPHCGKENLDYGTVDFYDDQCYFPRDCPDCNASGEEWYSMEFIGHENINTEDCLDSNQEENDSEGTNK